MKSKQNTLLIVESPSKAKTLGSYLKGYGNFIVLATKGHVRDIPSKTGAIDPDKDFQMNYVDLEKSAENIAAIKKAAKRSETILLATDPDREGEAIAWHVVEILKESNLTSGKKISRVAFYQITKKALIEAIESPRDLDNNLINAQQTRRALDYLVGFNLSPLLWKKVKPGLSAGRVQSPALVMLNEREKQIKEFVSKDYYYVNLTAGKDSIDFESKLVEYEKEKIQQFYFEDKNHVIKVLESIKNNCSGELSVSEVTKKRRNNSPPPPFTTSTLQQEAAKKYRFSTSKTMRVAQQLYEGLDINGETKGLITYMRTDSVNIGKEAIDDVNSYIEEKFGKQFILKSPRVFKSKAKNAQEAHEAIRPVMPSLDPEKIRNFLDQDQFKIYYLIWARTIASQMPVAEYSTLSIILLSGDSAKFKATGSTLVNPGYLKVYKEEQDDTQNTKLQEQKQKNEAQNLPDLSVGDKITAKEYRFSEHATEPPPRYSEASLVKTLEEFGIGRPSTYASIISTLTARNYAEIKERRFFPTDTGEVVGRFLVNYFKNYVDYNFTANLENDLDLIALGDKENLPVLREFWQNLKSIIEEVEVTVQRQDVTSQEIDEKCPECQKNLQIKLGRRGNFIGCSGYPDCNYTRSSVDGESEPKDKILDRNCPECNASLVEKAGKYGSFVGCTGYPKCKYIESTESDTGPECPKCKENKIKKRFTKRGKIFYGCGGFPKCKYALWNEPYEQKCRSCDWPILIKKITKKNGEELVCPECNENHTN